MDGEVIEARFVGRRQLVPAAVLAALALLPAASWLADRSQWWMLLVVAELVGLALVGVVVAVRSARSGWVLRLDGSGVTVRGSAPVAWGDLERVVVGPPKPLPGFVSPPWLDILAIQPRHGVDLPGPPHYRGRPQQRGAGLRRRLYGTNLAMMPSLLSTSADQIAEHARLRGLEVERRRGSWRGFALLVALVSLITVGVGLLAATLPS